MFFFLISLLLNECVGMKSTFLSGFTFSLVSATLNEICFKILNNVFRNKKSQFTRLFEHCPNWVLAYNTHSSQDIDMLLPSLFLNLVLLTLIVKSCVRCCGVS